MSFFSDLGDAITGKTKNKIQEDAIAAQLAAANAQITAQTATDALKLNPAREKLIMQMVIGVSVVVGAILITLIIKKFT